MDELLYVYGIVPAEEESPLSNVKGVEGKSVEAVNFSSCAAIVSYVPEEEYGEHALKEKTDQMDWVQEKAFHHHEALLSLRERSAIIPMKFCTIFQSEESLGAMVQSHQEEWTNLLKELEGKEEWNVKLYCDRERLKQRVTDQHPKILEKKAEIEGMSKGKQYLQRKKMDQLIDQKVEETQAAFSKSFHNTLQAWSVKDAVKKMWDKRVTGKDEEMCWNGAYLLPLENVEPFLKEVTTTNDTHGQEGWKVEVTGPWPAYHFVTIARSEV